MILDLIAEVVGEQEAAAIWRQVLAARGRKLPRGQTNALCEYVWAVHRNTPAASNREVFATLERFLSTKGIYRAKGSITRTLYRHYPAFRAKKEAELTAFYGKPENALFSLAVPKLPVADEVRSLLKTIPRRPYGWKFVGDVTKKGVE